MSAPKTIIDEYKNNRALFSTWQWIGIIAVLCGALVSGGVWIDSRVTNTIKVYDEENDRDRERMHDELKKLPPQWLVDKVKDNTASMKRIDSELSSLRVSIAELSILTRQLSAKIKSPMPENK